MLLGDTASPLIEFLPRPLKPMVRMPEFPGWQRWPRDVVVAVGCRHDYRLWLRKLKQHTLQSGKPGRIQMFDHFDNRGRIKARKSLVAIDQRAVNQLQSLSLAR